MEEFNLLLFIGEYKIEIIHDALIHLGFVEIHCVIEMITRIINWTYKSNFTHENYSTKYLSLFAPGNLTTVFCVPSSKASKSVDS